MYFNPTCGCGNIPSGYPQYPHYPNTPSISICDPCNTNTGCPVQLDFECILYNKSNSQSSSLTCLNLPNGSTLKTVIEAIDPYICQVKAQDFNLPCLRADYTINNLSQFANAVDTELCSLQGQITTLEGQVGTPITPSDSQSVDLTVSGTFGHTLKADVKISATSDNQASILSDGVYVAPQTLSVDYANQELTINDGNTVSLAGLVCNPAGFLGNLTSDPSSLADGQYWFRTDLSASIGLKIHLNGVTRTITTS